ncbi:L-tyrosine/L-tryptophan isonitrile synthase family protein [Legionella sp. WA2022007384]
MNNPTYNLMSPDNDISSDFVIEMAKRILAEVMIFRRVPEAITSCRDLRCSDCSAHHLPKIISAVTQNKPVTFVLPAFPGKSPNPEKVLGHLPDLAERLSLRFLGNLCQRIKKIYIPGIKIILCSDGRVFSDVVGMVEEHVSAYQHELDKLIAELALTDVSIFNLDDFYQGLNFVQMREELMKHYGNSAESKAENSQRHKTFGKC